VLLLHVRTAPPARARCVALSRGTAAMVCSAGMLAGVTLPAARRPAAAAAAPPAAAAAAAVRPHAAAHARRACVRATRLFAGARADGAAQGAPVAPKPKAKARPHAARRALRRLVATFWRRRRGRGAVR
jgi:hypothetical protein